MEKSMTLQERLTLHPYVVNNCWRLIGYEVFCATCKYCDCNVGKPPCLFCSYYSQFTPTKAWTERHPDIKVAK